MFLGFYNYTVVLTYLSLCISTLGIFLASMGDIKMSVLCLMLSGFCDMFDGKVASTRERTKEEKRFGVQIDSLCDLICFGVLPIMICYQFRMGAKEYICAATIYLLAALIRLSYFNVMEEQRQDTTTEARKYYQGLPVTTIALILPLAYLIILTVKTNVTFLYSIVLVLVAIMFLVPFNLKKLSTRGMVIMAMAGFCEFIMIVFKGI
ncbi:MAG: CDP-alcohol phosphatidyltransferase family protein [Oscillospiraceae bacterium]